MPENDTTEDSNKLEILEVCDQDPTLNENAAGLQSHIDSANKALGLTPDQVYFSGRLYQRPCTWCNKLTSNTCSICEDVTHPIERYPPWTSRPLCTKCEQEDRDPLTGFCWYCANGAEESKHTATAYASCYCVQPDITRWFCNCPVNSNKSNAVSLILEEDFLTPKEREYIYKFPGTLLSSDPNTLREHLRKTYGNE